MKRTDIFNKQVEYLNDHDCNVMVNEKDIEVETYTDAGGDMIDTFDKKECKNLKASMLERYENYDINHEVSIWWPHGEPGNGVPFDTMREHFDDLEAWKKGMLAVVKGMPNDDGTMPEPADEEDSEDGDEQVEIKITCDKNKIAQTLRELLNEVENGGGFHTLETEYYNAEMTDC